MTQSTSSAQSELIITLHRQRGGIRKTITEFIKKLNHIKQNLNTCDIDELEVALENVTARFSFFSDIQDQLEEIDEEKEAPEREQIESSYFSVVAEARKIIRKLQSNANNTNNTNNVSGTNNTATNNSSINIPVPAIQIPKFDGTPEKWASFYSVFKTTIHNNSSMPKAIKLYHLLSVVTDKAWSLIGHLDIEDINYETALNLLTDKYENTRRLARRHWAILRDYPHLKKDTPVGLGELVDTFKQHTKALQNLKIPVYAWDIPLIDLILSKINQNTIYQWEITIDSREIPKYTDLLNFLEQRANCADFSVQEEKTSEVKKSDKIQNKKGGISLTTTTTRVCPICSETHSIYKCDVFKGLTQQERYKAVIKASLCLNCLTKGHGVKDCKSTGCRTCSKKHHTFLHRPTTTESEANTTAVPVTEVNNQM